MAWTLIRPALGALAAACILGLGTRLPAAEALTADDLWRMFSAGSHKTHSVDDCEAAIHMMRSRFPTSEHLAPMEFMMGERLLASFMKLGFTPENGASSLLLAMDHLKAFLPGGSYAEKKRADAARLLYAKGLVAQRRYDEARALLLDLASADDAPAASQAFRTMVLLREPLSLGNDALAPVEAGLAQRLVSESRSEDSAGAEFLSSWAAARDSSLGPGHLLAKTGLHKQMGQTLNWLQHSESAKANMTEAISAGEAFLALPSAATLEQTVNVRFWMGQAEYLLGRYDRARERMESILPYQEDPSLTEVRAPFEARLYWNVCLDVLGAKSLSEIDADLLDALGSGKCNAPELAWVFSKLAGDAERRGETVLAYLYLRDAVKHIYDVAYTWPLAQTMRKMEEKNPELKKTPVDVRSPGDQILRTAGLTTQGPLERLHASGKKKVLEKRQAEGKGSADGKNPIYYRPWVPAKKRIAEPLEELALP